MTKQQLVDAIYELDPSYLRLKIDLNTFSEEQLLKHYNRKKNAPVPKNRSNWYTNFIPSSRKKKAETTQEEYDIPVTHVKEEEKKVALTGFDALNKERMN
jgi:hypothetical protein